MESYENYSSRLGHHSASSIHPHDIIGGGYDTQSDTKANDAVRVGAIRNQTIAVHEMTKQATENYHQLAAIVDAVLGGVPDADNTECAKQQFPGGEIGDLASSLAQLRDKIRETGSLITRLQSIASL